MIFALLPYCTTPPARRLTMALYKSDASTRDNTGDGEQMSTTQLESAVEEMNEIDSDGFAGFDSRVFWRGLESS